MPCRYAVFLLLAVAAPSCFSAEPLSTCLQSGSVAVNVRMAGGAPVAALLEAGIETPLRLVDAATGHQLWSAADRAAIQVFPDMDSAIFGSIAAIDLDADGIHDRIYAGDIAGRLWRFDVHHGAEAGQWTSGGILADFTNNQGRGFIASPDLVMSSPPGVPPWLNISIGTAAPGNPSASNRFYVVRDHAPFDTWSDDDFESWKPVREEDLMKVSTAQASAEAANVVDPEMPGWYIELGSGHVIAPSITVNHRVVLGIAEAIPRTGPCEILTRIASLELDQGRVVPEVSSLDNWTRLLPVPVLLSDRFEIGEVHGTVAPCSLGGQLVAACDVDTRPRKTWWRREDAE